MNNRTVHNKKTVKTPEKTLCAAIYWNTKVSIFFLLITERENKITSLTVGFQKLQN
jgi:hypothetical protein